MRILIIAPRYRPYGQYYELPLGLASISSYLKAQATGLDKVIFINLNEYPNDDILPAVVPSADILLTGGLSVHYRQIKGLISRTKSLNPNIRIVLGGGIISSDPELVTAALKPDLAVIGEGELIDLTAQGIVRMPAIDNLDALPFPDYEGLGVRYYLDRQLCGDEHYTYPVDKPRALPIVASRSCPHNCSFCFHPTGRTYRQRSLDNVFSEIEHLVETYQINILTLLDELFSAFPDRVHEFCDRIRPFGLRWMTQIRVDSLNPELLSHMKDAGCFQLSLGIESMDDRVLESMHKHTTAKQIEAALGWCYSAGIGIQGNLIFGDKAETVETAQNSITWWRQNKKYAINMTHIVPYPGTELYQYAIASGILRDRQKFLEDGCPVLRLTPHLPAISGLLQSVRTENELPAKSYHMVKTGQDAYRGDLYRVEATCPHCNFVNNYSDLYFGSTGAAFKSGKGYRIACRACNQRFDLPIFKEKSK